MRYAECGVYVRSRVDMEKHVCEQQESDEEEREVEEEEESEGE